MRPASSRAHHCRFCKLASPALSGSLHRQPYFELGYDFKTVVIIDLDISWTTQLDEFDENELKFVFCGFLFLELKKGVFDI